MTAHLRLTYLGTYNDEAFCFDSQLQKS